MPLIEQLPYLKDPDGDVRFVVPLTPPATPAALKPLYAAISNRDNAPCRIVVEGTSVSEGTAVAGSFTNRWVYRFQEMLRGAFPTKGVRGGVGYLPVYFEGGQPDPPATFDLTANTGGTSTAAHVVDAGLGARCVILKFGAAVVWTYECTSFKVHYAKDQFSVPFDVLIDGVVVGNSIATSNASLIDGFEWTSPALDPGVHTVKVQTEDTTGFYSRIEGVTFFYQDETKGIIVYDASKNGATAALPTMGAVHQAWLTTLDPAAIIYEMVTNDAVFMGDAATFKTNLTTRFAEIATAMTGVRHSLITLSVSMPTLTLLDTWAAYLKALREATDAYSTGNGYMIDMADWLGATVAGDLDGVWADAVHMSKKGNALTSDRMLHALGLNGGAKYEPDLPVIAIPVGAATTGTPPTGQIYMYSAIIAGRPTIRWTDSTGLDQSAQAHLGQTNVRQVSPGSGTALNQIGTVMTNTGTVSHPAPATTNLGTSVRRSLLTSGTTAGNLTSTTQAVLDVHRGNAAGRGGFHLWYRFRLDTLVTGNRAFVGLRDSIAAPTNVDPTTSTALAKIGLAINANSGNWNLVHGATGAAVTLIALGASFPVNNTDMLELVLFAPPNGSTIGYRVVNYSTGAVVSGTLSTNLPVNTAFMALTAWFCNNAQAAAVAFSQYKWYLETDL